MALIDVDTLLAPVGESEPCGPDLEYDSAFLALEEASRGKAEQQFGDTIIPAEDPDWRKVQTLSSELMTRTKDVRVAVHLLRATTRLQGLAAAADGLRLIQGLLTQYWDHVHPKLDADDDNDPTMRLNALAPLVDGASFLTDLRKSSLGVGRASLTGRDIELASGKAQPYEGESVTPMAGVTQALLDAEAQQAGLLAALGGMADTVAAIDALVTEKATISGPEFRPLRLLLQTISDTAKQAAGANDSADAAVAEAGGDGASATGAGAHVAVPAGALRTRDDAVRALEKVCEWIELNEPSNPAPLLIRRAQRLMSKNFMDIIRDLVPDGVDTIAKLAGVPSDQY
ncbi:MAG: type VI secretion system protein TssA [Burkholderiales bacterium]|nr:MAG: type VI secretion system protein TssA [Burkholderiales bacterium]